MGNENGEAARKNRVFHEQQRLMLCGVHCLNNLFCNDSDECTSSSLPLFTQASLDIIAVEKYKTSREIGASAWLNPHRSFWGLGNYDVVVLETAVTEQGCKWEWFDSRQRAESIDLQQLNLVGLVINVPISFMLGLYKSNHWYTVRWCGGVLWNLDSHLSSPQPFTPLSAARTHLQAVLDSGGHIFLVHRPL